MIANPIPGPPPMDFNVYILTVVISEVLAITVGTVALKKLLQSDNIEISWKEGTTVIGLTAFISFALSFLIWFFAGAFA
jgi:hypothetical protein